MSEDAVDVRAQIAAELEQWQAEFSRLVDRIEPQAWEASSGNAGWNVRQVVGHLAAQPDAGIRLVGVARSGGTMLKGVPHRLLDLISLWLVRLTSRGLTPDGARARYDAGHDRLSALLAAVGEGEFSRAGTAFGQTMTVAQAFRELGHQVDAHSAEVQVGLDRAARQAGAAVPLRPS
jgi:DinB superfamily